MTSVLYVLLKEMVLSMAGKVMWGAVAERFATRLVVYGLEKLESYSTNYVVKDTVNDIKNQLKGKGLKVIDG
jgi:hypothetical protein